MQMAGNLVAFATAPRGFVSERDCGDVMFSDTNAWQAGRWIWIMVPGNPDCLDFVQQALEPSAMIFGKLSMGNTVMKGITQKNDCPWFQRLNLVFEELKRTESIEWRDVDAAARQTGTVLKVHIGHDKCLMFWRKKRSGEAWLEGDAGQRHFVLTRHGSGRCRG
jgi:hypothetical protein